MDLFAVIITLLLGFVPLMIAFRRWISRNRRPQPHSGYSVSTTDRHSRDGAHYPANKSDIYHVAFLLREALVPDLAPSVLNFAEYWIKSSTARRDRVAIYQHNAGFLYLDSAPVEGMSHQPVQRIVFAVESHDQGWSDFTNDHGTYRNSWTWFCVSKKRAGPSRSDERQDEATSIRLFTNLHASRGYSTHTIEWSPESEDPEVRQFVRGLVNGDQIQLGVWARFGGWSNHVSSARIDVYSACVR